VSAVTPEDREKAIWTTSSALAEVFNIGTNPNARAEAEHVIDVLIALGWGPVTARPTREALAGVLGAHQIVARGLTINTPDECSCGAEVGYEAGDEDVSMRRHRAFAQHQRDALLSADHLWTEQPKECPSCGAEDERFVTEYCGDSWHVPTAWSAPVVDREALTRWYADHDAEVREAGARAALEAFELYFCDENENFLLDLSGWGGRAHWDESVRGAVGDSMRDHLRTEPDADHGRGVNSLLAKHGVPSVPVVDREALTRALHSWLTPGHHKDWDLNMTRCSMCDALSKYLVASGIFQDAGVVRDEGRAEGWDEAHAQFCFNAPGSRGTIHPNPYRSTETKGDPK
jgi:hypothetical protein